jgi:RHS repeat-associated protein
LKREWSSGGARAKATLAGTSFYQNTSSLVSALVSAVNGNSSMPVTASASGNSVVLTGKTTGPSTDYSLAVTTCELLVVNGSPYGPNCPSSTMTATASGANLTGGVNSTPAIPDTGTVWVSVNGFQASAGYGQGSTTATVASAIASVFNNSGSSPVNASVSGAALTLTSKQMGAGANYALTSGSSTNQPGTFSQPSFSVSVANLTSGKNAGTAPGTIYNYSVAYAPNGDVLTANDAANGNWTYAYDAFNRLLTAASSNTGLGCDWVYDRFGNRLQQNPYNGSCGTPQYTSSGGNNRMDGYSYDAAGNLTTDSNNNTYTYDAENRISQVGPAGSTATYGYDAAGQRVRKTSSAGTVDYIYDLAGHEIAEVSSAGALNRGEVYAGSRHLATYDGGTTYFNHVDWLGTERVRSSLAAMLCEQIVSLPFGDGQAPKSVNTPCTPPEQSPMHFTGKQWDAETNLDYFGARYDASSMGRFMTPDWAAKPTTVPYADFGDPQSLNLYGYVRNNPLSKADADGHFWLELWNWLKYEQWTRDSEAARKSWEAWEAWVDMPMSKRPKAEQEAFRAYITHTVVFNAATAIANPEAGEDVEAAEDEIEEISILPALDWNKQEKHFEGHNSFSLGKSTLTANPEKLAQQVGKGTSLNNVPLGQLGSKERVDFGKVIGNYVDNSGQSTPTTKGIVHYSKDGIHIVPAKP